MWMRMWIGMRIDGGEERNLIEEQDRMVPK